MLHTHKLYREGNHYPSVLMLLKSPNKTHISGAYMIDKLFKENVWLSHYFNYICITHLGMDDSMTVMYKQWNYIPVDMYTQAEAIW